MTPEIELWRKYLRQDPTRFLLDPDANPSVYLWYLIDIAHRPEDSVAVLQARERVLFSAPVQELFAAQREEGYWEPTASLAQPYYRATLWNLALLAELGIPRDSRRARAACEFALANFLDEDGHFGTLNLIESAYLVHALAYFRPSSDERISRAATGLARDAERADSIEKLAMLLWAWADFRQDREVSAELSSVRKRLLDSLITSRGEWRPITFPAFEPRDPLFILRVLAIHDCANDARAAALVDRILARQNAQARWPLETSLDPSLVAAVEAKNAESRWATLNALRVVVKLVGRGGDK